MAGVLLLAERERTERWCVEVAAADDHAAIQALARAEPAIMLLADATLAGWIASGSSLVVRDPGGGAVIGHFALDVPAGGRCVKLRTAVVAPEFRGRGVNAALRAALLALARDRHPGALVVSQTRRGAMSRGLARRFGGRELAPDEVPAAAFNCPPGCARRGASACGCVFFAYDADAVAPPEAG